VIGVTFTDPRGTVVEAAAEPGDNLLRLVIVAPEWFDRLPRASEEEEDMLDLAAGACRTSRLACQIELTPDLDGLSVRVPPEAHDMRRL
jgi:hypothetical protein